MSGNKDISLKDEEVLRNYRKNHDPDLIGQLFNQYIHLVYGLCLKYLKNRDESQDAVMDIYESISKKLLDQEVKHFKSWLYMVSKNHCLMILRKNNPEEPAEIFMESPDNLHLKEEKLSLEKDLEALEECIEELKKEQRECVKLFFIKKKSYHEVEGLTGLNLKKVKSYIQNGKRNLKICLENKNVRR